ncbi:MAG: TNT domain-containing protein, partial [Sciscionella sp.]
GELFSEGGCDIGEAVVLVPGTELDRFGTPEGRVLAAAGTPFAQRSLPPSHLVAGYHRYQVTEPLPVWRTVSASWFAQPGGGVRYRIGYPVTDLVALGYLTDITHDLGQTPEAAQPENQAGTSQHEGS